MQLCKYEIRKIFGDIRTKIIVLIVFLYLVFAFVATVLGTIFVNTDGTEVTGMAAVKEIREEKMVWNGLLTEDIIKAVIQLNSEVVENDEYKLDYGGLSNQGYYYLQGISDIRELVNRSFGGIQNYNYYEIDALSVEDAEYFYSNRKKSLEEWLESESVRSYYTGEEKEYLLEAYENMEVPLNYSYMHGWSLLMENSTTILYALAILSCILVSSVFAKEYKDKAAPVYYATYKGGNEGCISKIISTLFVITVVYGGICLLLVIAHLGVFGVEGGSNQIQSNGKYWYSIYSLTNKQGVIFVYILGYLGCLVLGMFSAFVSAKVKSSNIAIILSFLLIMGTGFLGDAFSGKEIQKIAGLMPSALLNGRKLLNEYSLYHLGTKIVSPIVLLPLMYIGVILLLIYFTYRAGKRYKI